MTRGSTRPKASPSADFLAQGPHPSYGAVMMKEILDEVVLPGISCVAAALTLAILLGMC